jgi:uncharacterized MAPEG superfamily protein
MSYENALVYFAAITLCLLSVEILFTYATQGFGYGFSSNRDPSVQFTALAMRIKNSYRNHIESAAYIVPVLVVAAISGLENDSAETAALLIVISRAFFAILYYVGLPFARLLGFAAAIISTIFIAYILLTSGLL